MGIVHKCKLRTFVEDGFICEIFIEAVDQQYVKVALQSEKLRIGAQGSQLLIILRRLFFHAFVVEVCQILIRNKLYLSAELFKSIIRLLLLWVEAMM